MTGTPALQETTVNIVAEGTRFEGKMVFTHFSRVHGILSGEVIAEPGSMLVLAETSVVEGNIHADSLVIDGYVRGDIQASSKVMVSRTGRVIGNIHAPSVVIEFGAFFEGKCTMQTSA